MHAWQMWIDLFQSIILAVTFAALLWYAVETMRQRRTAATQLRLSIMPFPQVVFHRAPDKVFLRNLGPGSTAKLMLQGFRFRWGQNGYRCTFVPVGGIIHPGREIVLDPEIEAEGGQQLLDRNDVFDVAFSNAWQGLAQRLILEVRMEDVLGNCYKSEVRISRSRFASFKAGQGGADWLVEMGKPELLRPELCMESPPLVDTTQASMENH